MFYYMVNTSMSKRVSSDKSIIAARQAIKNYAHNSNITTHTVKIYMHIYTLYRYVGTECKTLSTSYLCFNIIDQYKYNTRACLVLHCKVSRVTRVHHENTKVFFFMLLSRLPRNALSKC